jgi:hypothetical protein
MTMVKNAAGWFCFVLLLGTVLGFSAGRWDAHAQTVDNKSSRWLAGTMTYGQSTDAFMIFDTQTNRLAAYTLGGNRRLELLAVRDVTYDVRMVTWGKQEPTVQEVKDAYDRAEKAGKTGDPDKK